MVERNEKRFCASCNKAVVVKVNEMNWALHVLLFVVFGLILAIPTFGITFIIWLIVFCVALANQSKPQCPKCGLTL